ncbi:hypothetical protein ACJRO7_009999 [Eucalyptus globulus]|uniref:Uncharacterized protein n=1 Tax=Eucalyptus globulus TaxID=34317 RepID=A0ABD3LAM2_EUCGL
MPRCRSSIRCIVLTAVMTSLIVLSAMILFLCIVSGSEYPTLRVAGLTVSKFTVPAPTRKRVRYEDFFFREVECFVYYHWDVAQTLAVVSAEPFDLWGGERVVIHARRMTKVWPKEEEEEEEEAVEDMDRKWRSVGTMAVGLGLRMQGRYVFRSWWKKSYHRIKAHCDNLRIAFANSTTEGSLVTEGNSVTSDSLPSHSLPSCSYGVD